MKALVYTKADEVVYRDEPDPVPGEGQVLVKVAASGICGSDMHAYHGHDPRRVPPLILGHEVAGTVVRILDTRKTTPGWRVLEKAAIRAGGGCNHRFGLYDGVLVKDNHIVAAGGIREAGADTESEGKDRDRDPAGEFFTYVLQHNDSSQKTPDPLQGPG